MKKIIFILSIFLVGILFISCDSNPDIADIKNHPREYVDSLITVEGKVTNRYSLVLINYFTLKQEEDSIYVITSEPLPQLGEELEVTGEVGYYTLGSDELLVIKEKKPTSQSNK